MIPFEAPADLAELTVRVRRRDPRPAPRGGRLRWPLAALMVCAGAAAILCLRMWGDPLHTWAGVPGDPYKFINFLAWYPHALTTGQSLFHDTSVNPPGGVNMMWETSVPLPALLAWPITSHWGPVATYNVVLVAGLTLDGWCSFFWLRRHVAHPLAALAGAIFVELGPYTGSRAIGHLNLVLVFAVPLLLIAFEEMFLSQRWGWARAGFFAGLVASVQLLCAEEPLAVFAVMAVVLLLVLILLNPRAVTQERFVHAIKSLATAAVLVVVLCGDPLYFQFFGPAQVHGAIQSSETYSTDLVNLFVPNGQAWWQPGLFRQFQTDAGLAGLAPEANA